MISSVIHCVKDPQVKERNAKNSSKNNGYQIASTKIAMWECSNQSA